METQEREDETGNGTVFELGVIYGHLCLKKKIDKEWADEKSIYQLLRFNENITGKL